MKKNLTLDDYHRYMKVVNHNIKETEERIKDLDRNKRFSNLSFEDWIKFQNGELKLKDI